MPHIPGTRAGRPNAPVPLTHLQLQTPQLQARFTSKEEAPENIPRAGHSSVAPWRGPPAAAGCRAHAAEAAADEREAEAGERAEESSWSGGTWRATVGVPGPSAPLGNEQRCSQAGRGGWLEDSALLRASVSTPIPGHGGCRTSGYAEMQPEIQRGKQSSPWQPQSHHPMGPGAVCLALLSRHPWFDCPWLTSRVDSPNQGLKTLRGARSHY